MSYDEDDDTFTEENFDESKLSDIEFQKEDELRGTRTYEGVVSFSYNGMDYDIAIEITESWDSENDDNGLVEIDIDYIDDTPDELYDVWDEIEEHLTRVIKRGN